MIISYHKPSFFNITDQTQEIWQVHQENPCRSDDVETRKFIEQTGGADEMSMVQALCTVNEQLSITLFSTP